MYGSALLTAHRARPHAAHGLATDRINLVNKNDITGIAFLASRTLSRTGMHPRENIFDQNLTRNREEWQLATARWLFAQGLTPVPEEPIMQKARRNTAIQALESAGIT